MVLLLLFSCTPPNRLTIHYHIVIRKHFPGRRHPEPRSILSGERRRRRRMRRSSIWGPLSLWSIVVVNRDSVPFTMQVPPPPPPPRQLLLLLRLYGAAEEHPSRAFTGNYFVLTVTNGPLRCVHFCPHKVL